ncbi:MAG: hypothetical protein QOJ36_1257, partial [Verrucomicrobiota bacterium]
MIPNLFIDRVTVQMGRFQVK